MASKRTRSQTLANGKDINTTVSGQKRRRRCLTIEHKIKLLDRLHAGERPLELSRKCDISENAIRGLLRCEKQLRQYAASCTPEVYRSTTYIPRDFVLYKTEQMLHVWYEEQRSRGCTLTIAGICAKARELYATLKATNAEKQTTYSEKESTENENDDEDYTEEIEDDPDTDKEDEREFKASKCWFMKFRKRYNLDFRSIHEADPLDTEAASQYAATFAEKIRASNYQPQQVFSAAQFSLAWKRMPERTCIAQRCPPYNKASERISLLFCGNAYGDYSVKPMLIHRTLSPFCLRTFKPEDLPVFFRARPRNSQSAPKVTPTHFHEWLTLCFTPMVRDYLHIMELPARCLLLLDPELLQQTQLPAYDDEFVQLEFLPANTAPLLQPMTLSVVPLFKCTYLRRVFAYFHSCIEVQPEQSLYKIWRNFAISEAIDIIQEALEELSGSCWNGGWQQVWQEIVREPFRSSTLTYEIQRIVDIGCHLPGTGFSDMTIGDIQQHLKLASNDAEKVQVPETQSAFDDLLKDGLVNISLINGSKYTASKADTDEATNLSDILHFETDTIAHNNAVKTHKISYEKQLCKVQIINKALALTQQLEDTVAQLEQHNQEEFLKFVNGLHALMQPYREMKAQLLQPSIRDYFK